MKNTIAWIALLVCITECFSQNEAFEDKLNLETINVFENLGGSETKKWKFEMESESFLSREIWKLVLPKSIQDEDKIIINRNELEYFLEMGGIGIQTKGDPVSNPPHWENHFGKQIQTVVFTKPLNALAIQGDKLVKLTLDSLVGLRYPTFYPYGAEYGMLHEKMVPIVYKQQYRLEPKTPILLVTSGFLEHLNLNDAVIIRDTTIFGTVDYERTVYKTGIDFNHDGQNEVLMYHEEVRDNFDFGDDGEADVQINSILAVYFNKRWYRTSFWQNGQDGIEGF